MKVYVSELLSCCEDCVCHNGVSGRCKLLHRTTFDIPPRDCPLQSLSDYTKQVRKGVVQDIWKEFEQRLINKTQDMSVMAVANMINSVLDQIQGDKK